LVLFYAPWCGHCQDLEPAYSELARQLGSQEAVQVGAIDCSREPNGGICRRHEIVGYPTLKALMGRESKAYNGARDVAHMRDWIVSVSKRRRGTRGGSTACPKGLFRERGTSAVVSLCGAHFPDDAAKHGWLVVFYNKGSSVAGRLREAVNRAALDLGNEPPARGQGASQAPVGRRQRLRSIGKRYRLALSLPRDGPVGAGPLAKVGGVCCDCDPGEGESFCAESLVAHGAAGASRPVAVWVERGRQRLWQEGATTTRGILELALEGLGVYSRGRGAHQAGDEL